MHARATHLTLVDERFHVATKRAKSAQYMAGYRAGQELAQRDIAAAEDRGIGIGLIFGTCIGIVSALVFAPMVLWWLQ